jgi:hypothetical protein
MESRTILDEIEETIARIETLNRTQFSARTTRASGSLSQAAQRLFRARQARLWWLRQVRSGMLAEKPRKALLH